MLDKNLKPWLLEVNNSPSYNTDSAFDKQIKGNLIRNTFKMLNVSQHDRKTVKTMERLEYEKRGHRSEAEQQIRDEERGEFYRKYFEQRAKHEEANLDMYERIYPSDNPVRMKQYKEILVKAKSMWIEATGGNSTKKTAKPQPSAKTSTKKDKAVKKTLISPFKKIYETSEVAKLKIKHKSKSNAETSIKKNLVDKTKDSQRSEVTATERRNSIEYVPQELHFSDSKGKCF